MAVIDEHRNIRAMMDTIMWTEGTNIGSSNDGYDRLVNGRDKPGGVLMPKVFTDFSDHPNKKVWVNTLIQYSTAAGRYQILYRYWPFYKRKLALPDFSPLSQDRYVVQQFRERRAYDLLVAGKIRQAVYAIDNIWASLPSDKDTGYGQPQKSMDAVLSAFVEFGGLVK